MFTTALLSDEQHLGQTALLAEKKHFDAVCLDSDCFEPRRKIVDRDLYA
jgi:hypothetical protein